ncbi:MAG: hypothetical protein J0L76_04275 [Rhodobacterales bacterium]|nr:hypothetical protein [Rhodobacterales bacterium]
MSLIDDIWRRNLAAEGMLTPRGEGTAGRRMANPVERLADYIEAIGLVPAQDADAYRYASLPLCVIDAVFSIGVTYESTVATVARVCDRLGWPRLAPSRATRGAGPQGLTNLLEAHAGLTAEAAAEHIYGNRQRTSSKSGILKAEAVRLFAEALLTAGIDSFPDITPDRMGLAEALVLGLPGQGSGIAFDYFRMLAGDDSFIKPDRMVLRFVATALDLPTEPNPRLSSVLVLLAARELARRGHDWTPRTLDYAIWVKQRGYGE